MQKILLFLFLLVANVSWGQSASSLFRIKASVTSYDTSYYNKVVRLYEADVIDGKALIKTETGKWQVTLLEKPSLQSSGATDLTITYKLLEGFQHNASVNFTLQTHQWSVHNFVFTPGSTYNGNRFESRPIPYSPRLMHPVDVGPNIPTIITDVPRLNNLEGPSGMQLTSGSSAYPLMGFWNSTRMKGYFIETNQGNERGDYGMDIIENNRRTNASFTISSPRVRQLYRYRIANNRFPSTDVPAQFKTGSTLTIWCRVHEFAANDIASFYQKYFDLHQSLLKNAEVKSSIPFSAAYKLIVSKYNQSNWNPLGFYAMDAVSNNRQWKPGWVSGMPAAYALWFSGDALTRKRLAEQNSWVLQHGISPSGLFFERFIEGRGWIGGDHSKFHTGQWHLVRSSADALFFALRLLKLMKQSTDAEARTNYPQWEESARKVCDTFVRIWQKNGQFGHFVNSETGTIIVGGSASGSWVPAALIQAAYLFNDSSYLETSKASARYYYDNFVKKGYTTGGPGDALQNPDSESCYGLLESFMALYSATNDAIWLQYAEETAVLFATWVMPYNYAFPTSTTMGKIDAQTVGTVWANTQNRHGAPGICTSSGIALFHLYRATGKEAYLILLRAIARTIPQYLSRPDRPIEKVPVGCIDERVSTCDWFEGIGEIEGLSTWSEIAMMLTYAELPGIYVRKDQKKFWVFDHVKAEILHSARGGSLKILNPTNYPAKVNLWVDASLSFKKGALKKTEVEIAAGGTRIIKL